MKNLYQSIFAASAFLLLMLAACTPSRKVIYFNNLQDSAKGMLAASQVQFETPIQRNDQLSITFSASNPQDAALLNLANTGSFGSGGTNNAAVSGSLGYLVESDGCIMMPYIGKVKAAGYTRMQLQDTITRKLADYAHNLTVNIRFMNYGCSVLGEVSRPGRIVMGSERLSILDAIGQSGDITLMGRSDNVLIIREENGQRTFGRINLLSSEMFSSPYFYLHTNDIVYVEPVKAKFISRGGVPQYLSMVAVGLSLILTIINVSK